MTFTLEGLDLDNVWEGIIMQVGTIELEDGNDLETQIAMGEERRKREEEITKLERRMASEKQSHKKKELLERIRELKGTRP